MTGEADYTSRGAPKNSLRYRQGMHILEGGRWETFGASSGESFNGVLFKILGDESGKICVECQKKVKIGISGARGQHR